MYEINLIKKWFLTNIKTTLTRASTHVRNPRNHAPHLLFLHFFSLLLVLNCIEEPLDSPCYLSKELCAWNGIFYFKVRQFNWLIQKTVNDLIDTVIHSRTKDTGRNNISYSFVTTTVLVPLRIAQDVLSDRQFQESAASSIRKKKPSVKWLQTVIQMAWPSEPFTSFKRI